MKRSLALIAAGFALVGNAHAVDSYLFGDSDNLTAANKLTINGSDRIVVDAGWYGDTGLHRNGNANYFAGSCSSCLDFGDPEFYRNWFVIDLTGLTANVTTLTLTVDSRDISSPGAYTLWDVTSDLDDLPVDSTDRTDIYADLGGGKSYGSFGYQLSDAYNYRTLELNSDGLADLNAAIRRGDDQWAIGGSFDAAAPIPEPETYALMLVGLGVVGWMARRRKA